MFKVIPVSIEFKGQGAPTPAEMRARADIALQNRDLVAYMDQVKNLQVSFQELWQKAKHMLHHDGDQQQAPQYQQPPHQYLPPPQQYQQPPPQYQQPPPQYQQPPPQYQQEQHVPPPQEYNQQQEQAQEAEIEREREQEQEMEQEMEREQQAAPQGFMDPAEFNRQLAERMRLLEEMIAKLHTFVVQNIFPNTASHYYSQPGLQHLYQTQRNNSFAYIR